VGHDAAVEQAHRLAGLLALGVAQLLAGRAAHAGHLAPHRFMVEARRLIPGLDRGEAYAVEMERRGGEVGEQPPFRGPAPGVDVEVVDAVGPGREQVARIHDRLLWYEK